MLHYNLNIICPGLSNIALRAAYPPINTVAMVTSILMHSVHYEVSNYKNCAMESFANAAMGAASYSIELNPVFMIYGAISGGLSSAILCYSREQGINDNIWTNLPNAVVSMEVFVIAAKYTAPKDPNQDQSAITLTKMSLAVPAGLVVYETSIALITPYSSEEEHSLPGQNNTDL